MPGPMGPDEVGPRKAAQIPEEVFEVFNGLITRTWDGYSAVFRQDDVVSALLDGIPGLTKERIFGEHLLDVEAAYRDEGWEVSYRKSTYGDEPFPATFTFSRPTK